MGKRPREERIAIRTGVVIVLIAVLIRVAYLAQYSALPDWFMLTVDNWYHHHWAQAVAGGDLAGGTTYFRAPFYVWCLGLLYAVAGSGLWVARVFGVVVGLLSIGATYLITNKLFDRKTAAVAALFQSVYPLIIYFEAELLLDPLFMLLLQVVVYRYLIWQESRTPRAMFCLG
ncbi:MAG: glycosyltransferase family 39 protein, partial [candidate division Zixibacteria bacterium]|nr:glycosyltransferase family 39 protein [candidate division Zixibacteria bacterium]